MTTSTEIAKSIRSKALNGSFVLSKDEAAAMIEFHCKIAVLQRENELDRACLDDSSDGGEVADGAIGPSGLTGDGLKCQPSRREGETTPAAGVAPCPSETLPFSYPFPKAV